MKGWRQVCLAFCLCIISAPGAAHAAGGDIVLYASKAAKVAGHWRAASVSSAAGGAAMTSSDSGWSSTSAPLASPANYFELTFSAAAGTPYGIWLRLRATNDSKWNDAVWVQFSDALIDGSPAYRIGTTSGLLVNLALCGTCAPAGWGWQNTAYWLSQKTTVTFATSGTHTIRIQTREDGVAVDQVVLSPVTYLARAPGAATNDATILSETTAIAPTESSPYGGTPAAIPGTIEAVRFDLGNEGVAYADSTDGNSGGAFRSTDVDIEASSGGGYNVGWSAAGEWLAYTVNVASAGAYTAQFRVASIGGGAMRIAFGAPSSASASITVPNTGGWQTWTTVTVPVTLAAGQQIMTVRFDSLNVNFRTASFTSGTTTAPSSGATIQVQAGGSLQAAIDAAKPGDTILLQAGATFVGNFVLRAKGSGTSYITIRSAAADSVLPGAGVRITPAYASQLPKLRSPNGAPVIATAAGAHHYRLQFLELQANVDGIGTILALGDGSSAQNTLSEVPYDLIVDRVYIHGDPTKGQRRGIALNSARTKVLNSHISDIKTVGTDSQAIAGWNGPGPFEITNNYLEGAAENIMFGGADPAIPNLVPSDITIRRNHIAKPLAWRSQSWTVKNLLELKNAQRVLIDGNLFENNWKAAQAGTAILMKSENQDGTAPWSVVQEVTFSNNIVRNVASAITLAKIPSDAIEINRITVRNNLFENVSRATYGGSGAFVLVTGGWDITIDHNTVFNDGGGLVADDRPSQGMTFTNNILRDNGGTAIKGSSTSAGNGTIATWFPGGEFRGGIYAGANAATYPAGNYYPPTLADVGFVNLSGGDYRLSSSSIYRGGGTDGKDPGVDFAALAAAQK